MPEGGGRRCGAREPPPQADPNEAVSGLESLVGVIGLLAGTRTALPDQDTRADVEFPCRHGRPRTGKELN